MPKITPFIWFEDRADEAAQFYATVFKDAKVVSETKLPENVPGTPGKVMMVVIELLGQRFMFLNGGPAPSPAFKINSAVSFVIDCADQAEVDHYWDALGAGGTYQQCG